MKTFDYTCSKCGFTFTYLQHGDVPPPYCPKCRGHVTRIISAPRAVNYNGPWSARFRRGLSGQKPTPNYPIFCDTDFNAPKTSV